MSNEIVMSTDDEASWASWKCDGGPHKSSQTPEGYIGHSRPMTEAEKVRLYGKFITGQSPVDALLIK